MMKMNFMRGKNQSHVRNATILRDLIARKNLAESRKNVNSVSQTNS